MLAMRKGNPRQCVFLSGVRDARLSERRNAKSCGGCGKRLACLRFGADFCVGYQTRACGGGYFYSPQQNPYGGAYNDGPRQNAYGGQQRKSSKSKIVAGLLGIFLGSIGVHNFYLGRTGRGIAQIVATICTCGIAGIWGFIEGILCLCGNYTDADGLPLSD